MHYYIISNKIIAYTYELDASLYNYDKLSTEQSLFYEQNPNASLSEILTMELKPPYIPTVEELLEQARATKYVQIKAEEDAIRDAGWEDTETGLRLFLRDEDTIRYTQFKVKHLAKPDDAILQIGTYQGWQSLTKAVAFDMLDRYGDYAEELYQAYSTRYAMLKYATTIEQIEAI